MNDSGKGAACRPSCLGEALGMAFYPVDPDASPVVARADMPVDGRTGQPFGFLSGGASLALAETLAGYGSVAILPEGRKPVGGSVSASHVSAVPMGQQVHAVATLLHRGRSTHLWNVDVLAEDGRLVSTARVLNHIISLEGAVPRAFRDAMAKCQAPASAPEAFPDAEAGAVPSR